MIERELTGLERRLYKFLDDMDFHLEYEPTKERWEVMRQKMKACKDDCKVSFGVICNGYSLHIELPFDVDKAMKEDESNNNGVKQLLMEIAKLKEESRWRKFPDEKPKEDTWCIVFHEGEIDSDHYTRFAYNKKCDFALYGNKVTHWMPMPSAPKEEK